MKSRRISLLIAAFILVFAAFACAGEIDQRINRAYENIDSNVQSGAITRIEAHRLKGELKAVREDEEQMRQKGRLNLRERHRINNEMDRLEKHINRAKAN